MEKIIHYCWFGGKPLPKLAKKCIKSWKKFLPDFEIREWNETNFDINITKFSKQAYDAKKWAFVSDVARIYALKNYGGIYFDTDMIITKNIDRLRLGDVTCVIRDKITGKERTAEGTVARVPYKKDASAEVRKK